jgi:hypothetical protein
MTTKEKAERETGPFVRPTNQCHSYGKKNAGGRYAAKTSEERFQGMMNAPELFKRRPIKPPLDKRKPEQS